jgi:hypothetical protein
MDDTGFNKLAIAGIMKVTLRKIYIDTLSSFLILKGQNNSQKWCLLSFYHQNQ